MNDIITGQLFFRETEREPPLGSNRRRWLVCGILALPEPTVLRGEHQYVVTSNPTVPYVQLAVLVRPDLIVDRTAEACGNSPDGLLRMPIWRT